MIVLTFILALFFITMAIGSILEGEREYKAKKKSREKAFAVLRGNRP